VRNLLQNYTQNSLSFMVSSCCNRRHS